MPDGTEIDLTVYDEWSVLLSDLESAPFASVASSSVSRTFVAIGARYSAGISLASLACEALLAHPAVDAGESGPRFLTLGAAGNLFVTDPNGDGLDRIDPKVVVTRVAGKPRWARGHQRFASARSHSARRLAATRSGSIRWGGSKWCRSGNRSIVKSGNTPARRSAIRAK